MPGALHPDRRARDFDAGAVQASSMEAWPAVGGGLLLGMIVPALSGATPLRHPIKNLFLRIDDRNRVSVIIPYVRLEAEALGCAAVLIADELDVSVERIAIENRVVNRNNAPVVADLCPNCALGLMLIAAAANALVKAAAATRDCATASGIAADAALVPLPSVVTLASGRSVTLRSAHG